MRILLSYLLMIFFSCAAVAQSSLPACKADALKHNCFGTYTASNGGIYVGEFKDGKRHGHGTHKYGAGGQYEGEFRDDKRNGQGAHNYPNGNRYVGEFKDDKRHGLGTWYHLADNQFKGDKFIGNYKDDLPNGHGTYIRISGEIHEGEYKDNKLNGQGILTFANGDKYVGEFKDGRRNGQGTLNYANGEKYVGEWKDAQRNGQGVEYASNSTVTKQGRWENGILVQSFIIDAQQFPFNSSGVAYEKERRVALVIGNATYKLNPLKNPVNDSNDMASSLRSVGFDVIEVNNATLVQMREATRRFADKLSNSDVGLVYYSGHGVEVRGKNYLIPVNADIRREYEVVDQAFDASQFLEMMDSIRGPNNKRVNILIVDACRNNELQRSWRSTTNGLARMDAPGGTFISFATAPGRVAADGVGRNSPYTKHLLQALKQPNMPIEQVFKVVRRNVMDETKGEQIPWENSSLVGDFFFTVQR